VEAATLVWDRTNRLEEDGLVAPVVRRAAILRANPPGWLLSARITGGPLFLPIRFLRSNPPRGGTPLLSLQKNQPYLAEEAKLASSLAVLQGCLNKC
jgi:hypothetical protein